MREGKFLEFSIWAIVVIVSVVVLTGLIAWLPAQMCMEIMQEYRRGEFGSGVMMTLMCFGVLGCWMMAALVAFFVRWILDRLGIV